jgi:hypothetical protein
MKTLKDIEMVIRLPPSCNRQDVRLLNNRNLAALTPTSWAGDIVKQISTKRVKRM